MNESDRNACDVYRRYHKALVPRFGFLENMGAGDLRPRDGAQNPMNGFHATNRVPWEVMK